MTLADKFRQMAEKIDTEVAYKRRTRETNPTHKRLEEEAYQRKEADRLEVVAFALRGLATAHDSNAVPDILTRVKTRKQVEAIANYTEFRFWNAETLAGCGIKEYNFALARQAMLELANPPDRNAENRLAELERKSKSLIGVIPDFFPTPPRLAEKMCGLSGARPDANEIILEPSAGGGALADIIYEKFPGNNLIVCEIQYSLRDLLVAKGYSLVGDDFLQYNESVNHIIMNPPFGNGADCDHVRHAYNLLVAGGSLVAVMSAGVKFRTNGKYKAFNDWRHSLPDENFYIDLPPGSFTSSGTGINAILFVLNKDKPLPLPEPSPQEPYPAAVDAALKTTLTDTPTPLSALPIDVQEIYEGMTVFRNDDGKIVSVCGEGYHIRRTPILGGGDYLTCLYAPSGLRVGILKDEDNERWPELVRQMIAGHKARRPAPVLQLPPLSPAPQPVAIDPSSF